MMTTIATAMALQSGTRCVSPAKLLAPATGVADARQLIDAFGWDTFDTGPLPLAAMLPYVLSICTVGL